MASLSSRPPSGHSDCQSVVSPSQSGPLKAPASGRIRKTYGRLRISSAICFSRSRGLFTIRLSLSGLARAGRGERRVTPRTGPSRPAFNIIYPTPHYNKIEPLRFHNLLCKSIGSGIEIDRAHDCPRGLDVLFRRVPLDEGARKRRRTREEKTSCTHYRRFCITYSCSLPQDFRQRRQD